MDFNFIDVLKNNVNCIGEEVSDFVLGHNVSVSNYLKSTNVTLNISFSVTNDNTSGDIDKLITRIFWGKLPKEGSCCADEKTCCKEEKPQEVKEETKLPEKKEVKVEKEPVKQEDFGFSIPTPPSNGGDYEKPKPPKVPKVKEDDSTPPPPKKSDGGIRDVQMLAIQAMMKLRKINYDDLVKDAFAENNIEVASLPAIEELTEEQALEVIRYGNNKFKKQ